ncbi:hypothetical protein BJX76DRAFT_185050 [Aspergillus varians]
MATIPGLLIRGITLLLSRTSGRITEIEKPEETHSQSGKNQWASWGLTCLAVAPALAPLLLGAPTRGSSAPPPLSCVIPYHSLYNLFLLFSTILLPSPWVLLPSLFSVYLCCESNALLKPRPRSPTPYLGPAPEELVLPQILTAGRRINLTFFASFCLTTTCAVLLTLRTPALTPILLATDKGENPSSPDSFATESHDILVAFLFPRPPQDALLLSGSAHSYWSQIAFQRHL